jgi:transcriptional regulator with XRE-family HTH domain
MQNMAVKFKSDKEKKDLAHTLKTRRKERGHTLQSIEESIQVNVGQLSRFEKGEFITLSNNLQKYCSFLQIEIDTGQTSELGFRLERFATRSPIHRAAAEEIINALEKLN